MRRKGFDVLIVVLSWTVAIVGGYELIENSPRTEHLYQYDSMEVVAQVNSIMQTDKDGKKEKSTKKDGERRKNDKEDEILQEEFKRNELEEKKQKETIIRKIRG